MGLYYTELLHIEFTAQASIPETPAGFANLIILYDMGFQSCLSSVSLEPHNFALYFAERPFYGPGVCKFQPILAI